MRVEFSGTGSALLEEARELVSSLSAKLGHNEKSIVCNPGKGSHQNPTLLAPSFQSLSFQNIRNEFPLLLTYPVYGISLQQPEKAKTGFKLFTLPSKFSASSYRKQNNNLQFCCNNQMKKCI